MQALPTLPDAPVQVDKPRTWTEVLLRTPLLLKLIVIDSTINIAAFVLLQYAPATQTEMITLASLFFVLVVNAAFVAWALGPLKALEETAARVAAGELPARARLSRIADQNLLRIAATLNRLLDRLAIERARVRTLASQVVHAGDEERAHIARELHDGAAQSLSALQMLMTAARADDMPESLRTRLDLMYEVTCEVLDEVRSLSHAVHPRVLDDLGLVAAVHSLVRRARSGNEAVDVTFTANVLPELTPAQKSVLYRVAQEAISNAMRHAHASRVDITLYATPGHVVLEIEDDGVGYDPGQLPSRSNGIGVFVLEERVALVDGTFKITTAPEAGVTVRVSLPLEPPGASP